MNRTCQNHRNRGPQQARPPQEESDHEDPSAPRPHPREAHRRRSEDLRRIIIPDTAKEKPQEGKVVAVGNGKIGDDGNVTPLDVKKGDKILFSKYAGTEVNVDGEECLIIREDDVLGVVE